MRGMGHASIKSDKAVLAWQSCSLESSRRWVSVFIGTRSVEDERACRDQLEHGRLHLSGQASDGFVPIVGNLPAMINRVSHRRVMVRPRMVLLHYARPLFVLHMAGAQILVAESARREDLIVGIEEIHSEPHVLEDRRAAKPCLIAINIRHLSINYSFNPVKLPQSKIIIV